MKKKSEWYVAKYDVNGELAYIAEKKINIDREQYKKDILLQLKRIATAMEYIARFSQPVGLTVNDKKYTNPRFSGCFENCSPFFHPYCSEENHD